jgi:hypothetical protein
MTLGNMRANGVRSLDVSYHLFAVPFKSDGAGPRCKAGRDPQQALLAAISLGVCDEPKFALLRLIFDATSMLTCERQTSAPRIVVWLSRFE